MEGHQKAQQLAEENKELFKTVQQLRRQLQRLEGLKKRVLESISDEQSVETSEDMPRNNSSSSASRELALLAQALHFARNLEESERKSIENQLKFEGFQALHERRLFGGRPADDSAVHARLRADTSSQRSSETLFFFFLTLNLDADGNQSMFIDFLFKKSKKREA